MFAVFDQKNKGQSYVTYHFTLNNVQYLEGSNLQV